jgi:hypothetical protein
MPKSHEDISAEIVGLRDSANNYRDASVLCFFGAGVAIGSDVYSFARGISDGGMLASTALLSGGLGAFNLATASRKGLKIAALGGALAKDKSADGAENIVDISDKIDGLEGDAKKARIFATIQRISAAVLTASGIYSSARGQDGLSAIEMGFGALNCGMGSYYLNCANQSSLEAATLTEAIAPHELSGGIEDTASINLVSLEE